MALQINTNIGALNASAAASSVNRTMEASMNRLSTGLRINAARDDAAGVAIASRLTSEIRGTNQAIRNAGDAQALIDTAEGAHSEIVNILQRMRELSVQAANDTNADSDRTNIGHEVDALKAEINRIKDTTTWAGKTLLTGSYASGTGTITFQIGTRTASADSVAITIESMATSAIGSGPTIASISVDTFTNAQAAIVSIDLAVAAVNTQRSKLGAVSNRLDSTMSNLTNIVTNQETGLSRVQDADFAAESTNLAKAQILQQASTAMLAQANASKQGVLQLLQG
jgi:flagellin